MLSPEASRAARGLLNWSVQQLAREAGVGTTTIAAFESGRPSYDSTVAKIAAAFQRHGVQLVADPNRAGAVLVKRQPPARADYSHDLPDRASFARPQVDLDRLIRRATGAPPSRRFAQLYDEAYRIDGRDFLFVETRRAKHGWAHHRADGEVMVAVNKSSDGEEFEFMAGPVWPEIRGEYDAVLFADNDDDGFPRLRAYCVTLLERYDLPRPGAPRYFWQEPTRDAQGAVRGFVLRCTATRPSDPSQCGLRAEPWSHVPEFLVATYEAQHPDRWDGPLASRVLEALDELLALDDRRTEFGGAESEYLHAGLRLGRLLEDWRFGILHGERFRDEQGRAKEAAERAAGNNARRTPYVRAWHNRAVELARENWPGKSALQASPKVAERLQQTFRWCSDDGAVSPTADNLCPACDAPLRVFREKPETVRGVLSKRSSEWQKRR